MPCRHLTLTWLRRCSMWPVYCLVAVLSAATPLSFAASPKAKGEDRVVNLFIWGEYISPEVQAAFKEKTGIAIHEANYSSNEELLAKIQAGAKGYDVIVPSDYMVEVMGKMGLLAALDKNKATALRQVDPVFLGKPYDPTNTYAVPYSWSMTGIAVNRRLYKKPVRTWMDLLANQEAAGRVSLLDDVRETLGAALKALGKSYNSTNVADLKAARDLLIKAKPRIKAFNSAPGELIKSGEVVLAQMYSQEAMLASRQAKGQAIEFVVPKEGATLALDNLAILKNAPHPEEAYALINFLMDGATQKMLVTRLFNGPVIKGLMPTLPKDLQGSPILYPPVGVFQRLEMMRDLGETVEVYDRLWSEIKVAK